MNNLLQPLANLLGFLLNLLFNALDAIGIGKIGIAIILFTIIIKVAMLPLTISQQKTVKISQLMQPEMRAIRAKYRGRRDQESQQRQNEEIRDLYAKYGASQTGGCIQMLIQLPILLALYNVFRNIPMHVGKLNTFLLNIFGNTETTGIRSIPGYADTLNNNGFGGIDWTNQAAAIAKMNAFKGDEWARFKELFPSMSDVISQNADKVQHMNNFFGINMSISPNQVWGLAILIPILAGVSQLISAWLAQNTSAMGDDKASQVTQKLMIFMMPVMSAFIAITVPAGLGVYWIATAVIQTILQLIINAYIDKVGPEKIIEKAVEKKRKKIEKRGVNHQELIRNASMKTRNINSDSIREKTNFATKNAKASSNSSSSAAYGKKGKGSEGSLADKARMVSNYADKKTKKKK
ncbi:MAG: YidC/Oxa1 family membrane protein insertase [Clostridiales bacterium]|nr:YidC/Oxa1 family membrane protein insertase [Clostridiales bacterium]MBS5878338.1 YidC/Oxa1 family membrane protein insertase [Clostridiales bacterium]MDU0939678.1 YidC/Oxa1 family membrane protein insertase [Clostridiales bacterium]MDU1042636.1 YidC/Oxa1 family membrane protein insertase [Clostridiales bacterium]MDU3489989.1 YidC/Oxa1 family membrane protein insertase [Clostridiales bacterium]